ncbi:MAG: DUF4412 domain-containing protein [Bacteroidota bacterium]
MKRIALFGLSLILCLGQAVAQNYFEGKIVFDVEIEGENAEMMAGLMPQHFNYLVKGSSLKFTMEGGMMQDMMGEFIINTDDASGYMVQHNMKKAYKMEPPTPEETAEIDVKPTVKKESETATIAGYSCQKYTVTMSTQMGQMVQEIWATKDIKFKRPNLPSAQGLDQIFIDGLDAFPLKIKQDLPMGMGKMTLEASEVAPGSVDAKMFEFPSDYSVEKFDPAVFGKQIMGGN